MSEVIEFGKARFKRTNNGHCAHQRILYDPVEKTVECEDCGRFLEPFDAFLTMVRNADQAWARIQHARREFHELHKKGLTLKAAKTAENAWRSRSMVPTCPHCHEAIFPEDGFGRSKTNKQMARERRAFSKRRKSNE